MIFSCLLIAFSLTTSLEIEYLRQKYIPNTSQDIVCNWAHKESTTNPNAVSHKNARGLFQLLEEYEEYFIGEYWDSTRRFNVYDPVDNATVAFRYLEDLQEKYPPFRALAYFNGGGYFPPSAIRYAEEILGSDFGQRISFALSVVYPLFYPTVEDFFGSGGVYASSAIYPFPSHSQYSWLFFRLTKRDDDEPHVIDYIKSEQTRFPLLRPYSPSLYYSLKIL